MEYRRARGRGRGRRRRRCVVFGFVTSGPVPPPPRWPGIRTMTVEKKMDDAAAVWKKPVGPLAVALKCYSWKVERGLSEFVCCPPFLPSLALSIYLALNNEMPPQSALK